MGAPAGLGAAHAAAVGFVVVAEEVEEAVEEEDAEFGRGVVAVGGGLGGGAVPGNSYVAQWALGLAGGKREDVGGVVLAEEVAVHALEAGVGGNEAAEGAAEGDFIAEGAGKGLEFAAAEAGRAVFEENQGFRGHELGEGAGGGSGAATLASSLRDIWRPMPDCSL